MKTGKIEKIVKVSPWEGSNGVVFYHHLEMDNGDKIDIGKKKNLAIGEELCYQVTDTQNEYHKAKAVNPEYNSGGSGSNSGGSNRSAKKAWPTEAEKWPSFALSYAKDIYISHGGDPQTAPADAAGYVKAIADELLVWLKENGTN
jgi:hypothetical protein